MGDLNMLDAFLRKDIPKPVETPVTAARPPKNYKVETELIPISFEELRYLKPEGGAEYLIEIDRDISIKGQHFFMYNLSTWKKGVTVIIRSKPKGKIRTISLSPNFPTHFTSDPPLFPKRKKRILSDEPLFVVDKSVTLVLERITLQGLSSKDNTDIHTIYRDIQQTWKNKRDITPTLDTLIDSAMAGKLKGNEMPLVKIYGGTLIMKRGATICNNCCVFKKDNLWRAGGVAVLNGTFIMEGGCISGNIGLVGGVNILSGSFYMKGGVIENNIGYYAGGVYINKNSRFIKYQSKECTILGTESNMSKFGDADALTLFDRSWSNDLLSYDTFDSEALILDPP